VHAYWPDSEQRPQLIAGHQSCRLATHIAAYEIATRETHMYTLPSGYDPYYTLMALVPGGAPLDPWSYEPNAPSNQTPKGGARLMLMRRFLKSLSKHAQTSRTSRASSSRAA
jgi:hypothetical protein